MQGRFLRCDRCAVQGGPPLGFPTRPPPRLPRPKNPAFSFVRNGMVRYFSRRDEGNFKLFISGEEGVAIAFVRLRRRGAGDETAMRGRIGIRSVSDGGGPRSVR